MASVLVSSISIMKASGGAKSAKEKRFSPLSGKGGGREKPVSVAAVVGGVASLVTESDVVFRSESVVVGFRADFQSTSPLSDVAVLGSGGVGFFADDADLSFTSHGRVVGVASPLTSAGGGGGKGGEVGVAGPTCESPPATLSCGGAGDSALCRFSLGFGFTVGGGALALGLPLSATFDPTGES